MAHLVVVLSVLEGLGASTVDAVGALSGILGACWHLLTILWSVLGQFWVHADHSEPHLLLYLDPPELRFMYLSGSLNSILKKCLQVNKVSFLTSDFREGCSQRWFGASFFQRGVLLAVVNNIYARHLSSYGRQWISAVSSTRSRSLRK